jgi:Amt family ammonium transporter
VRTKNMLSVLMQVFMIVSVTGLLWCCWGYSMAFTSGAGYEIMGNQFFGGFSKVLLAGGERGSFARDVLEQRLHPELRSSSSR